ncbi:SPFH domain/band 7 family protein (macronuclear) [Tetrahymena thermophila SB210]|uniref:SPFH domain/band 7 family protein n=1 Tax=Tetrahymena thermophila (strain SB210) TaxID=312017 RepID=I7M0T0_TETTS|nr:SPFH domain/band 7 family protein [Tetrahymena thermophila SB210]EAR90881.2 SPFH domain/band 7 family protein [Tetrahymena thermophila SB210]|eukprot:XP_001011126.2 SPFH domain/band 7 family protein [Tetrahymena thermophila SB210]
MSQYNDSHDKNVLELPLINQSSDIVNDQDSVPLEPQHINISNYQQRFEINRQKQNQKSNPSSPPQIQQQGNTQQNLLLTNNNTNQIISNPPLQGPLMQPNPNFNQTKEIYIGNAQQSYNMQQQQIQMQQQQFVPQQQMQPGFFNPQIHPNQINMMQPSNQMLINQQHVLPQIQLTPEEIARRQKRLDFKNKFQRQIPEENPDNLKVEGGYQKILYNCGNCCGCCGQYCPCFCCSNPMILVDNSFRGIYERFGKYVKNVDAGLHFVNPCTDQLIKIDMKTQNIDLGMQQSLTQDNILLFIHGVVQYRILDCRKAYYSIDNIDFSVKELSICALRSTISQFKYQELLDNRDLFRKKMEEFVEEYIHDWGIDVEQIIIKDMNMDQNISQQLASAAKEVRLAQAKIQNAKADVAAAEEQRKAADQLASKAAMQIRYLSTLERIASKSKVVFLAEH